MSVVVIILQQHSGKHSSISLNFSRPFNISAATSTGRYSYSELEIGLYSAMSCNGRYNGIF